MSPARPRPGGTSTYKERAPPDYNKMMAKLTLLMADGLFDKCLEFAMADGFDPEWLVAVKGVSKRAKANIRMTAMKDAQNPAWGTMFTQTEVLGISIVIVSLSLSLA